MKPLSPLPVAPDVTSAAAPQASAGASELPAESPVRQPEGIGGVREMDTADIPPTDILFECPKCGKSLSIEPRGAGLVINCTRCGEPVAVPIPEGMEIDDVDATQEELAAQLQRLRRNLDAAQSRVAELEEEVALLRGFRDSATKGAETRAASVTAFKADLLHALKEQESALSHLREAVALSADLAAPPVPDSGATDGAGA
ncbi:MAG: hypothetical protein IJ678_03100 [Kiritimatiellae bacterium]|nr:hypothetical protein [Kiritimatiellia bacterium]